ncbi:MAG: HesA/MoeB/ThiF family protein [Chitinophagaceae bacterium]|nr:HesA/MoeB/ThiF family protein [Chitinophagaceae bacterium]
MEDQNKYHRYQRQIILPGFGMEAQKLLEQSKVLVIGAGGLGCPCIQFLVGAGVGHIGIVDGDDVAENNLHRQMIYTPEDIGRKKTDCIEDYILKQNPDIHIVNAPYFLKESNATSLIEGYDVVIDCTDQIKVRYLINDTCIQLNKPYIFGAIYRYEIQIALLNVGAAHEKTELRDIFPQKSNPVSSCEESGILGAVCGIAGSMQALEAIKFLAKMPTSLNNALLIYNTLQHTREIIQIKKTPMKVVKQDPMNAPNKSNYKPPVELDAEGFLAKLKKDHVQLVDVRNEGEQPIIDSFQHICIPLSELHSRIKSLDPEKEIVLFCHAGIRSLEAMEILSDEYHFPNVSHLRGGLVKLYHALQQKQNAIK